jgi:hypothetical protein
MPNDCSNSFAITDISQDQWCELANSFQVRSDECQQDFLKTFYSEPDWQNTPNENGELPSSPDERGIAHFSNGVQDLRWYEWRNNHWGTKWDVYSCCNNWQKEVPSNEFSVNFLTAWSPLSENCMAVLSRKFPGSLLTNYYEEEGNDFYGVTLAKNGIVCDFSDSMSKHREAYLRQQFPDLDARFEEEGLDIEDDLDEFFWDNCDLGEFSDFIFKSIDSLVAAMTQEVNEASTEFCDMSTQPN